MLLIAATEVSLEVIVWSKFNFTSRYKGVGEIKMVVARRMTEHITSPMRGLSWEVRSYSACQEIPRLLRKPKITCLH
jgi:hypothetical protein